MVVDLLHIGIALEIAPAHVERNIGRIDHTLQQHEELRHDIFHFIGYKNLVGVELDLVFLYLVVLFDLREIQDTSEVEGIVHIQMDPEQRQFIVWIKLLIEVLIIFSSQL